MTVLLFRRPTVDPAPYTPDPRNGEVYACEAFETAYIDGAEVETPAGFIVVHMSRSGDSAGIERGFETLETAQAGALREAVKRNAVLLP